MKAVTATARDAPAAAAGTADAPVRARAPRRVRPLRALLATTCVLTVAAWLGSLAAVVLTAHHDAATSADAIIVLGAAQYDGRPSPVLRARLDHAITLYHRGFAPRLVVTGGNRRGDRATEAGVGRQYALSRGVPDSAILLESEGRSTRESLRAAAALLRQAQRIAAVDTGGGATGDSAAAPRLAPSAILVSDPFHLLRLAVLARRFGIRPYPSAAPNSPIGASSRLAWEYYLRESVKVPFVLLTEKLDEDE